MRSPAIAVSILAALIFSLVLPSQSAAQTWSAEQQEVIEFSNMCWQASDEAARQKDYDVFINACQPGEDFRGWWLPFTTLWDLSAIRKWNEHAYTSQTTGQWNHSTPLAVKIYDDVALYWFLVHYFQIGADGTTTQVEEMRFEAYHRVDGKWHLVGVMVAEKERGVVFEGSD